MKTLEQIREAKVGVVMNPKVVGFQVKDAMGKISHSLKHKNGMHHVHVSGNDTKDAHSALKSHPLYVAGKLKVVTKEEVELDEMKEPFVVVDTADGNKVVGMASSEKGAKEIITTSQLPPMKIKNKKTLKIVKVKKKQMIGQPIKEEVELEEKMDPTDHVKKKGDKFCVYNADGSIAKEFDNKKDADKYAIANHDKMMATKEEVELEESMTGGMKRNDPKLVKIFDKLKKGSTVKIKHNSSLEAGKDFIVYDVKSKNLVNRGRVEKITLARKDSPASVKRYLYKRDGGVSFAIGDMAGMITAIKEAKSADVKPENYTDANGKVKVRMVPVKREDSDAVKAFLAKGGKIKKLAPGKAQGYHGKEDPGTDTHGLISRGDTSRIGTRKKVKSMGKEETKVDEAGPGLWANIRAKKARGETMRKKGAPGAPTQDAIRSAQGKTEDNNLNPPFDNAVKRSTKPTKDKFGNVIKNRARSLARAQAKSLSRTSDMKDKK